MQNWQLPPIVKTDGPKYFEQTKINQGIELVKNGRVTISFSKGAIETYYIASGIIKDNSTYESKIVYKARLEGTEEGPFSSQCNCPYWNEDQHCVHTAALFVQFHLKEFIEDQTDEADRAGSHTPPLPSVSGYGVNVEEYGSIIAGAHKLQGAFPNSTYSSLQYLLHNHRVVSFPIPGPFSGKLIVNLVTEIDKETTTNDSPILKFIYQKENGELCHEISLFENLYLFNWQTGEVYHLPHALKDVIQKFRYQHEILDINHLIEVCMDSTNAGMLEVYLDSIPLSSLPIIKPQAKVFITSSTKKNLLDLSIHFADENDVLVPVPRGLYAFSFSGGGLLGHFRKKQDAYDFIGQFIEGIRTGSNLYGQFLNTNTVKDYFHKIISFLTTQANSLTYDSKQKRICQFDNSLLIELLAQIHESFGGLAFRFSEYQSQANQLFFQITSTPLFAGLYAFHKHLQPFGIEIYYQKGRINYWNSQIRFERKMTQGNWFNIELNISAEDQEVITKAEMHNGISISSQGLVLLSPEQKELLRFMKKYTIFEGKQEELEKGETAKYFLPLNRARIFELFELRKLGVDGALTEQEIELCKRLESLEEMPNYPLPQHFEKLLRPYQKVGHNWLNFLYEHKLGACLADDMGLGKTIQAISFIESIFDRIERVLIVCPVTILLNWENEFKRFSNIDVTIYHGDQRQIPNQSKVILTSYSLLKREYDTTFKDMNFDVFILDEVQHLKNIRSLGAYAARQIQANFRICLTGTPVENDLSEFYNIIDLSLPGIWGELSFIKSSSAHKTRLLARKTAKPFILRRTKKQVLTELPPKEENVVYLNFTQEEREHYLTQLVNTRNSIAVSPSKRKYGEILKGLLHLRQNCLWQGKPPADGLKSYFELIQIQSTKIHFLLETLDQIVNEGHQALIFSQFTTYLDHIQGVLSSRPWNLARIDGAQSLKKRQQAVDEFQSGKSQIFLISLKAGGVGLNLTAASYVFLMDPWWNPAVENQAIDRAHRIGQSNKLTVFKPIIKDSVEEKVLVLQDMKRELFRDLLPEDEELFSGKLTMKDFEQLLE